MSDPFVSGRASRIVELEAELKQARSLLAQANMAAQTEQAWEDWWRDVVDFLGGRE